MSAPEDGTAPVLVLGLGNVLLRDDGAGIALLRALELERSEDPRVELVDGGTQGIALLGLLDDRRALLVLDAVARGAAPGTLHVLRDVAACSTPRGTTSHEGNAATLLLAADLLQRLPERLVILGIEPAEVRTGVGLSEPVRRAVAPALDATRAELAALLAPRRQPCTN